MEDLELKLLCLNVQLIKLPKLRRLAISNNLVTVKVKNIVCPNLTHLSLRHTDDSHKNYFLPKLKKLICVQFQDWQKRLTNLETLIIGQLFEEDQDLLRYFEKLKYLDVYQVAYPVLARIMRDQERLERHQLKIFYRGLSVQIPELEFVIKFNYRRLDSGQGKRADHTQSGYKDFYKICDNPINLYAQNLERTAERLHFFEDICIEDTHRMIDSSFFGKLHEVSFLTILPNSLSEAETVEILQKFPILKSLSFEAVTNVGQGLFDKLPIICPFLHTLHIKEDCKIELENYQFLRDLRELRSFTMNCANLTAKEKADLNQRLDSHTRLEGFPFKKSGFNPQSIMLLPKY